MARYSKRIVFQACLIMTAAIFAASTGRAQLINGGFETGDGTGWTLFNDAAVVATNGSAPPSATIAHSGQYSLQTYGPYGVNFDASGAYQDITSGFSSGQTWVFSGYLLNWSGDPMGNGSNGFALAQIKFLSSGVEIQTNATVDYGAGVSMPEDVWQHFIVTAVVPPTADTMRLYVLHVGESGSVGSTWWDDMGLYQQTGVTTGTVQPGVQISWPTLGGENTQVQSATNLGQPTVWSNFGPVWQGAGVTNQISDVIGTSSRKFYKITQVP